MDAAIQSKSGICRFLDGWLLAACHASRVGSHRDRSPERTVWGGGGGGGGEEISFPRREDVVHICASPPQPVSISPLIGIFFLVDQKLKRRQLPPQRAPRITCESRPELGPVLGASIETKSTYAVQSAAGARGEHFNSP